MGIEEFNKNTPRRLATIAASGEPMHVTNYRKRYVTVVPTALFEELLQAAGERGQEILAQHRKAVQQPEEARAA